MKSFLAGKKVLSVASLRATPGAAALAKAVSATSHGAGAGNGGLCPEGRGAPEVAVVKEGDKVVRLVVTCTCGERVEIECLYPAGG